MSVSGEAVEEDTDLRANTVGSGWALTLIISLSVIAWAQARKTERQAVVGAGAGAVIGGAVGRTVGSITNGVIVGAIVGGAAGAMIRVRRARLDGADVPAPNP